MGGRCLKAYRTTKMALGKYDFLYEGDLDRVLAITDADLFGNDEDMESDCNLYQNSTLYRKLFVQMRVLSKSLSIQSRFIKARESKTSTAQCP